MTTEREALDALRVLEGAGFDIPKPLNDFVLGANYETQGLKEVWYCPKCKYELKSYQHLTGASHSCIASKSKDNLLLSLKWKSS